MYLLLLALQRVTDTYTAVRLLVTSDPREFLDDYFVTGAPSTSAVMASSGAASSTPSVGFTRTGSIGRPLGRPSIKYATAAGAGSSSSHGVGSSSRRRREADGKGASEVAGSSAQGLASTGPSLGELLSPEALAAAEQLPQLLMFMAGMRCEKLPIAREDDCVKTYMAGVQARVESGVKVCLTLACGRTLPLCVPVVYWGYAQHIDGFCISVNSIRAQHGQRRPASIHKPGYSMAERMVHMLCGFTMLHGALGHRLDWCAQHETYTHGRYGSLRFAYTRDPMCSLMVLWCACFVLVLE